VPCNRDLEMRFTWAEGVGKARDRYRKDQDRVGRIRRLPHALQMLFPLTRSLRHTGVVLVLQFTQDKAPTTPEFAKPLPPFSPEGLLEVGAGVGF
jgi:hypothetical protein